MSQPALAVEGLTAEDVTVDTVDGQLQRLTIAPTMTVAWSDYPAISEVELQFRAEGPQSNGTVIEWSNQSPDNATSDGQVEFDFDPYPMLQKNGGPLDASSFEPAEGEERSAAVTVFVDLRLIDENGEVVEEGQPIKEVTYTVAVTYAEGQVTVSGKLNTAGECIKLDDSILEEFQCRVSS
ncbi:hypothetical protein [Natronomonas sp.]